MLLRHKIAVLCMLWAVLAVFYFAVQTLYLPDRFNYGSHKTIIFQESQRNVTKEGELPVRERHYLCVRCRGRLGNHMFQYAALYGIAKLKHMVPLLGGRDQLRKYFNIWAVNKTKGGKPCQGMKPHKEKRGSAFDIETISFSDDSNTELVGQLQSFRYFDHVEKDIRKQFQFPTDTVERAKQILQEGVRSLSLPSNDPPTLVAIHVRRGDRVREDLVKLGMTVAPIEYINNAKSYFINKYKNVIFVVCSDTMDWCTANMDSSQTIFMKDNPLEIDMAAMRQCNHTIMTVGTFGWWVGWLVNGETIYYKRRVAPNSPLSRNWNMSDHYPANWIAML